jgi:RNA polymerase sigma-70 factor (ECF subfamily)
MGDDLAVIRRILDGDVDSFRVLVERYQGPLRCFIRNLVSDTHEGEDLAQDVFLAAFRNLASYDPRRAGFGTWLLTIARNRCLNALARRRPVLLDELPDRVEVRPPDVELNEAEWFRLLDRALDALPFEQKAAFILAEIQGLSLAEIATIEGVKPGTVKSRLSRARDRLRSYFRRTAEPL